MARSSGPSGCFLSREFLKQFKVLFAYLGQHEGAEGISRAFIGLVKFDIAFNQRLNACVICGLQAWAS